MHRARRVSQVVIIAVAAGAPISATQASPEGHAAADQVTEAGYRYFLGDNLGVPGILFTHAGDNRGFGPQHDLARDNIVAELTSYGLTVELEPFTYSGTTYFNVVATQVGTLYPDKQFIIGAHFDSVNNPGADDNASGTALMLQAASVLSKYPSDYTMKFIAFDREEQGLIGSYAYVDAHAGEDVLGMISTDMVAYNRGTNAADIYAGSGSLTLQSNVAACVTEYGDGLGYYMKGSSGGSDHRPFERAGYAACLFIEDWGNPFYHTAQDNVDEPGYIDYAYATRMTRSIVGWMVDSAVVHVDVCYADCDDNGALDLFDFLCFQDLFGLGDPGADCDGDGVLDFFDFLCFQNAFGAGCS